MHKVLIDLGTTNIVIQLYDVSSSTVVSEVTITNPQRRYGADVISRIDAANHGKLIELSSIVRKAIFEHLLQLPITELSEILIAGNPTMIHILMGYDCTSLGEFPYHSSHLNLIHTTAYELELCNAHTYTIPDSCVKLPNHTIDAHTPVCILPGLAGFIGGDVVAGILYTNMYKQSDISILIDLGTNGELIIGNQEQLLVTSTAIGPAFDGYKGKYGTELLSEIERLIQEHRIDPTGYLLDYEQDTSLKSLQHEIRDIQLAKAALRAGLEILVRTYGVTWEQISSIYVAGAFGLHLDLGVAIRIGLLPNLPFVQYQFIGNSSLLGLQHASKFDEWNHMEFIKSIATEVILANESDFQDLYLQYMYF